MATEFPDRDVAVVLTGREWAALLAHIANRELTVEGRRVYRDASKKLGDQLLAAQAASQRMAS